MPDETAPPERSSGTRAPKSTRITPNALLSAFGRLTRDPEERTSDKGHPYTRARVACNLTPPRREGEQHTLFFDVTAFRHQAAALAKCRRGDQVHVMGTLTMEQRKGTTVASTRTSASSPTACWPRQPRNGPNDRAART